LGDHDPQELIGIELAEAVEAVRDGLLAAAARGADRELRFELGPIQMEFTLEVRRDARAKGGVKAWVIDAGAEAGSAIGRTHKVSFTLTPKPAEGGGSWEIAAPGENAKW
jgi:hypothetical protein